MSDISTHNDLKEKFIDLCAHTDISSELIEETWCNYNKMSFAFNLEVYVQ